MSSADEIRLRMHNNQQIALKQLNADKEELESKVSDVQINKETENIVKNLNRIANESN